MLLEGLLVPEVLAAVRAGVRVLSRVHTLVFQQVLPAGKRLEAFGATVAPLAVGVAGLVAEEGLGVAEALPALPTGVELSPGLVDAALVFDQVVGPHEALVALPAAVRPLPGMDAVVVGQLGLLGEALLALGTLVGLLPRVGTGVVVQVLLPNEGLAALGALEGARPLAVGLLVDHQAGLAVEGLVALRALVRPVGVDGLVPRQLGLVAEAAAALGTDKGAVALPHGMSLLVDQQAGLQPEAFRAEGAGVRSSGRFGDGHLAEAAVTLRAQVGLGDLGEPGFSHRPDPFPVPFLSYGDPRRQGKLRRILEASQLSFL